MAHKDRSSRNFSAPFENLIPQHGPTEDEAQRLIQVLRVGEQNFWLFGIRGLISATPTGSALTLTANDGDHLFRATVTFRSKCAHCTAEYQNTTGGTPTIVEFGKSLLPAVSAWLRRHVESYLTVTSVLGELGGPRAQAEIENMLAACRVSELSSGKTAIVCPPSIADILYPALDLLDGSPTHLAPILESSTLPGSEGLMTTEASIPVEAAKWLLKIVSSGLWKARHGL